MYVYVFTVHDIKSTTLDDIVCLVGVTRIWTFPTKWKIQIEVG